MSTPVAFRTRRRQQDKKTTHSNLVTSASSTTTTTKSTTTKSKITKSTTTAHTNNAASGTDEEHAIREDFGRLQLASQSRSLNSTFRPNATFVVADEAVDEDDEHDGE